MNTTEIESRHYQKNVNRRLAIWTVLIGAVLLILFIIRVPWTSSDYFFGGSVLFFLATGYEFITVKMQNYKQRIAVAAIVILALVAILGWAASGP